MSQYDLEQAMAAVEGPSRKTISTRLKKLRDEGFTHRPRGERGGEAITDLGRKILPADALQPAR